MICVDTRTSSFARRSCYYLAKRPARLSTLRSPTIAPWQASKQASKQASEQASKQASEQASEQASKQASEQANKHASKLESKGLIETSIGYTATGDPGWVTGGRVNN